MVTMYKYKTVVTVIIVSISIPVHVTFSVRDWILAHEFLNRKTSAESFGKIWT